MLVEELLSASGVHAAANAAAVSAEFLDAESDDGADGWEDEPTLDLGLASTKADLMNWAENNSRGRDDETQAYLIEFFKVAARDNVAGFQDWFNMLAEEEKAKLTQLAA